MRDAVLVADNRERAPRLAPPGVEGRVDVDQLEGPGGEARQQLEVVAQQDLVCPGDPLGGATEPRVCGSPDGAGAPRRATGGTSAAGPPRAVPPAAGTRGRHRAGEQGRWRGPRARRAHAGLLPGDDTGPSSTAARPSRARPRHARARRNVRVRRVPRRGGRRRRPRSRRRAGPALPRLGRASRWGRRPRRRRGKHRCRRALEARRTELRCR